MPFVPDSAQPTPGFRPDPVGDAADKAAQGMKPNAQAISTESESPLAQFLKKGVSAITSFRGGLVKGASLGYIDPSRSSGPDIYKTASQESPIAATLGQVAGGIAPGAAIGSAAGAVAPVGRGVLPTLGRIATSAVAGGLQGGLQNPGDTGSRASNAKLGAFLGGGLSAAGELASPLLNRISDLGMKKAVGIKKDYTVSDGDQVQGVGNRLLDLGVGGTKSQMQDQVAQKLASQEQDIQDLTSSLQDKLSPKDLADAVSQHATQRMLSNGTTMPGKEAELQYIRDVADKYNQMESLSPNDLLKIKRGGGFTNAGNPGASLADKVDRTVAGVAREKLGTLDPAITEGLGNEKALLLAKKPLNADATVHQGLGSGLFFGKAVPAVGSLGAGAVRGTAQNAVDPVLQQAILGSLFATEKK